MERSHGVVMLTIRWSAEKSNADVVTVTKSAEVLEDEIKTLKSHGDHKIFSGAKSRNLYDAFYYPHLF